MSYSEAESIYRLIADAAQSEEASGKNGRFVICKAAEERQRGYVMGISTSTPLNVSVLAKKFPGAQIYVRGDKRLVELDVGFDVYSTFGKPMYFFQWWMLAAVWVITGAVWKYSVIVV